MSGTEREQLQLRAIRISTHSALAKTYRDDIKEAIKDRADELLSNLESIVQRQGGDEAMLAAIASVRREIRE